MQIFKSRTILFSVALAVLSVAQGSIGVFVLDQQGQAVAGMLIAGAIAALRVITTTPLLDKKTD